MSDGSERQRGNQPNSGGRHRRPGLGLGLAFGVVVARIASVLAGAASALGAQWLLLGLAGAAVAIGHREERSAGSAFERRLGRMAQRVGAVQLLIGVLLIVVTLRAPHLIELVTDRVLG